MHKALIVLLILGVLAGCGGRKERLVSLDQPYDTQLSCVHLKGEYASNNERVSDISEEKTNQAEQNLGRILVGGIFIMNVNDTEQKEIEALVARNEKLVELGYLKKCVFMDIKNPA